MEENKIMEEDKIPAANEVIKKVNELKKLIEDFIDIDTHILDEINAPNISNISNVCNSINLELTDFQRIRDYENENDIV